MGKRRDEGCVGIWRREDWREGLLRMALRAGVGGWRPAAGWGRKLRGGPCNPGLLGL